MSVSRLGAVLRQFDGLLRDGTLSGLSDRELVERFRERSDRSEAAFACLVERHGPMVFGVCRSILNNPSDIDDAFQATFLVLVRRSGSIWVRDSIGPWLYNVANRVAIRARADAARRRFREERSAAPGIFSQEENFNSCERSETVRLIHEELARLPERWRGPIVLCHLEGLTHEEASRSLGVPVGTVRSRLSRGRDRLKDRLVRRGLAPAVALGASWTGLGADCSAAIVSASLVHRTVTAATGLASGWILAGPASVATVQLTQGVLMTMFLTKLKTAAAIVLVCGGTMAVSLKAGGAGGLGLAMAEPGVNPTIEPGASELARPEPVTTAPGGQLDPLKLARQSTVRITVRNAPNSVLNGSGTIISSTAQEAIILTSAGLFGTVEAGSIIKGTPPDQSRSQTRAEFLYSTLMMTQSPVPVDFEGKVSVVFFTVAQAKSEGIATETITDGTLIGLDPTRDLALIRIRPGASLPDTPIVPTDWIPTKDMELQYVGCPEVGPPTARATKVIAPRIAGLFGRHGFDVIECYHLANPGDHGGGLFTPSGLLAGILIFSGLADRGYYIHPATIREFLDSNGLKHLYAANTSPKSEPTAAQSTHKSETSRDPRPIPAPPEASEERPVKSTVQIRIFRDNSVAFGSGTVISSKPEESLVLTCGHLFKMEEGRPYPEPSNFADRILVELIDWYPQGTGPNKPVISRTAARGTLVDIDLKRDLGLIRIKPERILPASPIVPPRWKASDQMRMMTSGGTEGQPPTAWVTRILNPSMRGLAGNPEYEAIECAFAPKQGRMGGGLFTDDGYLAGVCNFAEPNGNRGFYASPNSIRQFLDRNGLKHLYDADAKPKADPAEASADRKPESWRNPGQIVGPLGALQHALNSSVRIRILGKDQVIFGSGAIIASNLEETMVLICPRGLEKYVDSTKDIPKIEVDLFDSKPQGTVIATVKNQTLKATVVSFDFKRDLGLLRIHPGRRLVAAPVVPSGWIPATGTELVASGCIDGKDPNAWRTMVRQKLLARDGHEVIGCDGAPKPGQQGGCLFTEGGQLVGVCVQSDAPQEWGYYVHPKTIFEFLESLKKLGLYTEKLPAERDINAMIRTAAAMLDPKAPGGALVFEFDRVLEAAESSNPSKETTKSIQDLLERAFDRGDDIFDKEKQWLQQTTHRVARLVLEQERREKAGEVSPEAAATPPPDRARILKDWKTDPRFASNQAFDSWSKEIRNELRSPETLKLLRAFSEEMAKRQKELVDEQSRFEKQRQAVTELLRQAESLGEDPHLTPSQVKSSEAESKTPDVEVRLKDVEQKLDRVLKLLETKAAADRPK